MKNKLLFGFAIAAFVVAVPFQSSAQVSFGVKGGYNLTNIVTNADQAPAFDARHGLHAGVFTELQVAILAVQIEALYSMQGATLDVLGDKSNYALDYLLLPAVAKIELGPLDVHAGLQYDMLLSAKFEDQDVKDSFKNGISMPIGAGIDVSKFQIEARYIVGLTNINDNPDFPDDKITNSAFQISLGIKF